MILSSPSGGGKTTIAKGLVATRDDVAFSVSATTRPPRSDESDGRDYHFLGEESFRQRIDGGEFLEWAEYGGYLYGTLNSEVERIMRTGRHVLMDIEIQGARTVRERGANMVSIFILPPSTTTLIERLRNRRTEPDEVLQARLRRAVEEIGEAAEYDYIVVNDDRAQAIADVARIVDAETHRLFRLTGIAEHLNNLRDSLAREAEALARAKAKE